MYNRGIRKQTGVDGGGGPVVNNLTVVQGTIMRDNGGSQTGECMKVVMNLNDKIIAKFARENEMTVSEVEARITEWFELTSRDDIFEENLPSEIMNY